MAKDIDEVSKKDDGARKQNGTTKRAKHRKISAASAERKRQAGMIRLSLWVPKFCADDLRRFASSLHEGVPSDGDESVQAAEPKIAVQAVTPTPLMQKRKTRHGDDRQLDLFGPQEPVRAR